MSGRWPINSGLVQKFEPLTSFLENYLVRCFKVCVAVGYCSSRFYLSIPLPVTLAIFQGHSSVSFNFLVFKFLSKLCVCVCISVCMPVCVYVCVFCNFCLMLVWCVCVCARARVLDRVRVTGLNGSPNACDNTKHIFLYRHINLA